jgi:hypothetical protein
MRNDTDADPLAGCMTVLAIVAGVGVALVATGIGIGWLIWGR